MRQQLKSIAYLLVPRLAERFFAGRQRRHIDRVVRSVGLDRVAAAVMARYGRTVVSGPFAGMTYDGSASGSTSSPKVLGSYEAEIHPWIESLCQGGFDNIIDVGCAEGYYAVGLARRCPAAHVFAFDIDPVARGRCDRLAASNGVAARVTTRGACSPRVLNDLIVDKALVVCDAEGYEATLFDPQMAPKLRGTTLLVELHEAARPGVTELLRSRFSATHAWTDTDSRPRDPADYPTVDFLPEADRPLALTEMRSAPQTWAMLTPLTH